jgi:hypothetical protein
VIALVSCAPVGEPDPDERVRVGCGDSEVSLADGDAWTVGSELAGDVGGWLADVVRGAAAVEVSGG